MGEPFIGSEAVAAGRVTPYELRTKFVTLHRDVFVAPDTEATAVVRGKAAWLWSRRRGIVVGRSASALHGAKWLDGRSAAEIICQNRHAPQSIRTWSDRLADDEVEMVGGVPVTTPARTALDLARRYPVDKAVAMIDALGRATHLKTADVELLAERYSGSRGIRRARIALPIVDFGAESPRETWLRLVLIRAGFPPPQTQIPVYDEYRQLVAVLDMGWEHIKVAADYEGEHHRTDRRQFNRDIRRAEAIAGLGWIDVRVTVEDTIGSIVGRVQAAWDRRV